MRYRLRTLLIVLTAISACLGWITWQSRIVANRQAMGRSLEKSGDYVVIWEGMLWWKREPLERISVGDMSRRVGRVRRWLGDRDVESVIIFRPASAKRSAVEAS